MNFEEPLQQNFEDNPEKDFKEIEKKVKLISQTIGLDFDMNVKIGEAGKGSFYNFKENSIMIDPTAKSIEFVAAHEGSHRALSKAVDSLKVLKSEENEKQEMLKNQKKTGWHFVFNSLEDVAVNDWVCKNFPKFEDLSKDQYSEFNNEIEESIKKGGSMPRFMRYGFEVINERYNGEVFKDTIPQDVQTALDNTRFVRKDYYSKIPFTLDKEEVLSNSWARYKRHNFIWEKEIEKLVEEDLKDEELKEFIKSNFNKGDGDLTEEEKKELKESVEKRKKELEDYLKGKLEDGEITNEKFQEDLDNHFPINLDDLDEELKEKLKKALENSSNETKEEIKEKAKKKLEDLEDEFNEKLTTKEKAEENSHKSKRAEEQKEKTQEEEQEKWKKIEDELIEKNLKNEWEKQRVLVLEEINNLYSLVEKLFKPTKFNWKKGYESGHKIDLKAAMQAEARPFLKLWERKYLPQKHDYKFSILIDQSGSMSGTNIQNGFLGTIIFAETLSKLKIPYEVSGFSAGFSDDIKIYKEFKETIEKKREQLSQIVKDPSGSTPTFKATEKASERLARTKRPSKNKAHFLLVVTDGEPDCSPQALKELNQEMERKNNQVIIGLGIGDRIREENLKEIYGDGRYIYCTNPKEFPLKIADLLKEIFKQTQGIK